MEENTEETKQYGKFQSRRFIIAIMCLVIIAGIVTGSFITKNFDYEFLAVTLAGSVGAYLGLETINKKYKYQNEEKE